MKSEKSLKCCLNIPGFRFENLLYFYFIKPISIWTHNSGNCHQDVQMKEYEMDSAFGGEQKCVQNFD